MMNMSENGTSLLDSYLFMFVLSLSMNQLFIEQISNDNMDYADIVRNVFDSIVGNKHRYF